MTKRKIRQDYAAKTLNLYKNCFIKRQRRGAQYLLSEYKDVNERILDAVFFNRNGTWRIFLYDKRCTTGEVMQRKQECY